MNPTLRRVFLASLLRRRLASALSLLAIALGVALGLAVQLIHRAALDEFGRGLRVLAGEAELQVVGPRAGFDEALYPLLALRPEVAEASPLLEVEASLPGQEANYPHACPDALTMEARFAPDVREALRRRGHPVVEVGDLDGPCSVEIIRRDAATGMLLCGSDPRRDGWALAW